MDIREEMRHLLDELPDSELYTAWRYLKYLKHSADPLLKKLLEAPEDDEELSEETIAALKEGEEDFKAGRVVSHEDAKRRLLGRS